MAERRSDAVVGPARHESPLIDDLALAAAREVDRLLAEAQARGLTRWADYLDPLPDRLRDDDLRGVRAVAMRLRAAYGPKDSVRDVLPEALTEPVLDATDRLLRELNREANRARG
jgi:hypothetical protein